MNSVVRKKFCKIVFLYFRKVTLINNQIEFLFRNKCVVQDLYIQYMQNLNEINNKIVELENIILKKKQSKIIIENYIKDINTSLENLCLKTCSNNIKNTLNVFLDYDTYLEKNINEYKEFIELINDYFIPLSCNKVVDNDKFIKKYNLKYDNNPIINKQIDISKNSSLMEKINGASIIFFINNDSLDKDNNENIKNSTIIYINGYFTKDSLSIFRNYILYKEKIINLYDKYESLDMSSDFKEKYIDQLSLRDFLLYSIDELIHLIKSDYNDFQNYKNKSLSALIKEFIKSNIEKQRRIITLFLISEQEYQFTAHIIFDLITDKSFLAESQYLSDIIFNSLHWEIQKIFKTSNENFENSKKKLENITINNVPYESRILAMNALDNVKAKAMEKLKEINGSKENSIKAQQWLDGLLKIPFNIYKKEPIIDFFRNYQNKIEKYIDFFTIRISEFSVDDLNLKNKNIYNIITQIIDEFYSTVSKSEFSYSNYIKYLEIVKFKIEKELFIINDDINIGLGFNNDKNTSLSNSNIFLLDKLKYDDSNDIVQKIIDKNIVPTEDKINECIKQLDYFKKIRNEITDNNILNENNINTMINKINDLECMLNINLLINENPTYNNNTMNLSMNLSKQSGDKELFSGTLVKENTSMSSNASNASFTSEIDDDEYNSKFTKYIIKILEEINSFIKEWNDFKDKKQNYMENVDNILNKCTYGQIDAKKQMKRIIGQWMNGNSKGQCFGLCGPPGVGKTTLCKNGLAKCLFDENGESRPFSFLPLGGATNGSILEGHHYTYLGSTWGKIVDILMETKCMNPIIYVDELDKISKTEHGKEIASILTHITDQSQNKEFYDKYFTSIPIDLSQVLFIFSYNNKDDIDSILRDRIQEIPIKALSLQDKLVISQNYVIPDILTNVGFSNMEVIFTNEILSKVINKYTHEAGVRKLNEILYDIVRDINLKKIEDKNDIIKYPIIIDDTITDPILSNMTSVNIKKINDKPMVGQGTGLYAYSSGAIGGITIIQVMKTISDKKISIEKLTGCLGDVMKESMNCSLTVAWNILPLDIKKEINESKEGFGLHIHCGDYQQKDGPSASIIQSITIISRLTNVAIRNDVAMTGEMDLYGNAKEIGGLYSKIMGAYNAGVKKVLIPKDNEKDLDLIFKREEEEMIQIRKMKVKLNNNLINNIPSYSNLDELNLNGRFFRNEMEIIIINDIFEALEYSLVPNDLVFNRDF